MSINEVYLPPIKPRTMLRIELYNNGTGLETRVDYPASNLRLYANILFVLLIGIFLVGIYYSWQWLTKKSNDANGDEGTRPDDTAITQGEANEEQAANETDPPLQGEIEAQDSGEEKAAEEKKRADVKSDDTVGSVKSENTVAGAKSVKSDDTVEGPKSVKSEDAVKSEDTKRKETSKSVKSEDTEGGTKSVKSEDAVKSEDTKRKETGKSVKSEDTEGGTKSVKSEDAVKSEDMKRKETGGSKEEIKSEPTEPPKVKDEPANRTEIKPANDEKIKQEPVSAETLAGPEGTSEPQAKGKPDQVKIKKEPVSDEALASEGKQKTD